MPIKRRHTQEDHFLRRAILGDRKGFEYLVSAYRDLAYTVALKIVLNKEDAEEVVQDAFMKAFGALGNFRRASKFSTWLYRIVYNTAVTKLHSKGPGAMAIDDPGNITLDPQHEDKGLNLLVQADRKKYIDLALQQLTEDERAVIALYYLGEKDIAEISKILGLKKSAVKMRLLRGRKSLKDELGLLLTDEIESLL